MNKTSKKYCRVAILIFLAISLLIPPATVFAYDGPIYAVKKAQAALQTKITGAWADESIDNVLKDLAKMAKVNIFTSPRVTGNITAELMDVPLEEVLTNILTALDYTFVATDNMIRVVPMHEITLAKEELVSKVYRIIYADANDVAASLREFVSNNGSVGVDRATNHIVVTDTEYKIRGVDKFIAELNRPRQQVLVEVKIYDITTNEGFNLASALYAANIPLEPATANSLGYPTSVTQTVTPGYTIKTTETTSEAMSGSEVRDITGSSTYDEAMSGSEARQTSGTTAYGENTIGYEDTARHGVDGGGAVSWNEEMDYEGSLSGTESTTENEAANYSESTSGTESTIGNETANYGENTSGTTYGEEVVPEVTTTETFYDKIPISLSPQYNRNWGSKPYVGGSFDRTRGGTLSFSLLNDSIDLELALNMLKKEVEYKVLANPRILVLDNETARFEIAREIPYRELLQVAREAPMTYTAFKNVGIQLQVTPQIAEDGMIKLHIVPEFGTLVSLNVVPVLTRKDDYGRDVYQNALGMPTIDVRRTDTVALVKNGQTVAIGGMRKRETSKTISKVPLLGDIPLLKNLFRSNSEAVSVSELVVLITPRIVSNTQIVPSELSAEGENGIPKVFRGDKEFAKPEARPIGKPKAGKPKPQNGATGNVLESSAQTAGHAPQNSLQPAYGYLKMGRFQPAKVMLESLITRDPGNGRAHQYLGYCNLELGNVESAIANYTRAVDLNDGDWEAHRGLGVAYMVKARSDEDSVLAGKAVEQWRISLNIKPDQAKGPALARIIEMYSE